MGINSSSTRKPYLNEQLQRGVVKAQTGGRDWVDSDKNESGVDVNRKLNAFRDSITRTQEDSIEEDERFFG